MKDHEKLMEDIQKRLAEYREGEKKRRAMNRLISQGEWEDLQKKVQWLKDVIDRSKLATDPEDVP